MITKQPPCGMPYRILLALVFSLLVAVFGAAQTQPQERTFHASKTEVENALRAIHAYSGGKLPVLEGFVTEQSLDRYRQPYYQYSLELTSTDSGETLLRVTAKITAWFTDEDSSRSGYRTLASNGRLESDLFDRLEEAFPAKTGTQTAPAAGSSTREDSKAANRAASPGLPDSASASKTTSVFRTPPSAPSPVAEPAARPPSDQNIATDKRIQQLNQTAKNLEEILHNQSRPDNLAVVKEPRTPILSRPTQGARVLLLADAEDEFQVLDTQGDWVHVQVTALLRGWVRRVQLDLSGVAARVLAAPVSSSSPASNVAFQQTREETGTFPGDWEPLRGKKVKIIWVQAEQNRKDSGVEKRESFARSLFRKAYPGLSHSSDNVQGLVIVFDDADGGMAAATMAVLQRFNAGELSESAFWKQCWLDPPEAFKKSP